ncbi:uncharacterized protein DUF2345 [Paraburkholderia sp. BL25I1N1]|nr:uncharacterized protein DUF2345 [Paraburkholderia sp. BL25I1N1]
MPHAVAALYPASSDFTFSGRFHDTGICMGVLRNHGMPVTIETRSGAQSPAKDMGEMVQRLTQARAQHENMAQLDAIRGGTAQWRENPFPEMTRPDLVVASAAGIRMTATRGTYIVSGQDHAVTAGRDVSVSSGRSLFASVRDAISVFAYQLGLKLVAAKGKVDIQAQSDQMALAALKDITSTDGKIVITASKEIWIGAGALVYPDQRQRDVGTPRVPSTSALRAQRSPRIVPRPRSRRHAQDFSSVRPERHAGSCRRACIGYHSIARLPWSGHARASCESGTT